MAGSKLWFLYTTDRGDTFGIQLDESNTEAVNGTGFHVTVGNRPDYGIPSNLRPRRVFYESTQNTRVISVVALTPAAYNNAPNEIPDPFTPLINLRIARKLQEKERTIKTSDTGLTDGDTEGSIAT